MPLNPKGCWDRQGDSGANHDAREGVRMRWLADLAVAFGAALPAQEPR